MSRSLLEAAVAAARRQFSERNPRSRQCAETASRFMPGGNTRTSLWHGPHPLFMARGQESRLTDVDGHEYVDFFGDFTAGIYGHSPQVVRDAIMAALQEGMNLSAHNRREARLAELICTRFPSMKLVRFTNSGTEANLMALAAAKAATGRRKILVFEGAYHGSVLAFPAGGSAMTVPHEFIVGPYNDIERSSALIAGHRHELAAILVEPMLGAGGCVPATAAFLEGLRDAARDSGAALIFDEIQTSRLSLGGRQAALRIEPDMTTIGKYFGGGLAFGCFGGKEAIMGHFDPRRPDCLAHAGTFNNCTLTMAAAEASIRMLLTEQALESLNRRGDRLREAILSLFQRECARFTVTGLGSLMNIHPTAAPDQVAGLRELLFLDLAAEGIYIAPRGLIALSLAISEDDTGRLLGALGQFLERRRSLLR